MLLFLGPVERHFSDLTDILVFLWDDMSNPRWVISVSQKLQGFISNSWYYWIQNNFDFNTVCLDPVIFVCYDIRF